MRSLLATVAMVIGLFSNASTGFASDETDTTIKVLLLSGQNNHDWRRTTPKIRSLLESTTRFKVDVEEHPHRLTTETLDPYDVIVSNWNSWSNKEGNRFLWSAATKEAYLNFVRSGGGHVVVHAGSASFPGWADYHQLTLATWKLGQTGHGPPHEFAVKISTDDHPITKGLSPFTIQGELWHHAGIQDGVTVLASAFSSTEKGGSGKVEPIAMVKSFGLGHSFTLLLGHGVDEMENQGFVALLVRGTEWAATGNVAVADRSDDVQVTAPTQSVKP